MRFMLCAASCLFVTAIASAEELEPGKYVGHYQTTAFNVTVTLDIDSVEKGAVKGKGQRHVSNQGGLRVGGCAGDFQLVGRLKGNELFVRAAEKFGPAGDCIFGLRGTVSGNKIRGKTGEFDIELTRS